MNHPPDSSALFAAARAPVGPAIDRIPPALPAPVTLTALLADRAFVRSLRPQARPAARSSHPRPSQTPSPWTENDTALLLLDTKRRARLAPNSRAIYETYLAEVLAYPPAELQLRHAMGLLWHPPQGWPSLDILGRRLIVTEHKAEYGRASDVLIGVQGSTPQGTLWAAGMPDPSTPRPAHVVFQAPHRPPVVLRHKAWAELVRAFLEERAPRRGGRL